MKHNFENLEVYKRSLAVSVKIMKVIDDVRPFRLAEQIVSSSISIPPTSNPASNASPTITKNLNFSYLADLAVQNSFHIP